MTDLLVELLNLHGLNPVRECADPNAFLLRVIRDVLVQVLHNLETFRHEGMRRVMKKNEGVATLR